MFHKAIKLEFGEGTILEVAFQNGVISLLTRLLYFLNILGLKL